MIPDIVKYAEHKLCVKSMPRTCQKHILMCIKMFLIHFQLSLDVIYEHLQTSAEHMYSQFGNPFFCLKAKLPSLPIPGPYHQTPPLYKGFQHALWDTAPK